MSEALAKSVGDMICEKNKNNQRATKITPTSPSNNSTTSNTNGGINTTTCVKNRQIRVVSAEHSNNGKSSRTAATQKSSTSNMSSMSSAVADLASGMPNFTSSSSSSNNVNNSAPIIISGTAAAVLALQSPFSNNSIENNTQIVSNSNSTWDDVGIESSSGEERRESYNSSSAVPNPLLQGAASSPGNSPTETQSDYPLLTKSSSNSISSSQQQHSPLTRTRYADGGPIIEGTAAAQMEAIATATAARITYITTNEDSGGGGGDDVINAVASLGSPDNHPQGGAVQSPHHGFNVGENINYKQHNDDDSSSRYWDHGNGVKTSISMRSGGNTLFSVDHGNGNGGGNYNNNNNKVTPYHQQDDDDDEIMSDLPPQTPKGGMDILAELTCHALPMALPGQPSHHASSSSSTQHYNSSYPQHHQQHQHHDNNDAQTSSSLSIPSYQEIYQDQQGSHHHYNHAHHQAQHLSPDGTKRVSAIPSYQEIYREMGLSPQSPKRQYQYHHAAQHPSSTQYPSNNNLSSYSYSVEEVPIDGSHRSSSTTLSHIYHHQQQNNSSTSTQPTSTHRTTTHFGHVINRDDDDLEEGKEIYTRKDICVLGGHCSEVKEVHGNMREGCDSLVIGSLVRFCFLMRSFCISSLTSKMQFKKWTKLFVPIYLLS